MSLDLMPQLLTGAFALGGGLGGVLLTGWVTRRNEMRRLAAEDSRRWLVDRRHAYAAYLTLAQSMLREIDATAIFLSYDGNEKVSEEYESFIKDGLTDYFQRWEEELQPALLEVQLMANPHVAELADRMSFALMEITPVVEKRGRFTDYYPGWFQARDMFEVLRNEMRVELGLPASEIRAFPITDNSWPWLPDRPSRESYVQLHPPKPSVATSAAVSEERSVQASRREGNVFEATPSKKGSGKGRRDGRRSA